MRAALPGLLSLVVCAIIPLTVGAEEACELVRIFLKDQPKTPVVAEIIESKNGEVLIFDLSQGETRTLTKDLIREIRPNLTEEAAEERVGLARLLAWKIKRAIPLDDAAGRIATVDGTTIYINLGKDRGLSRDQQFAVYRGAEEVRDPSTNELLDRIRRRIGTLTVVEVRDRVAKCRHLGEVEATYLPGDEVEVVGKSRLAVFPIRNLNGDESSSGKAFTEELIADLIDAGLPLVDRTRIDDALTELAIQHTGVFDEASIQKIGGLLGATYVVGGSIEDGVQPAAINVRVVNVATGEIELAHSATLAASKGRRQEVGASPTKPSVVPKGNLLANATIDSWQRKGDWRIENGKLQFKGQDGMITLPSELPSQFQLSCKATPASVAPVTCLALYLKAKDTEIIVQLAEDGSCVIADGKDPRSDRTAIYGPVFVANKPNVIVYQVRDGLIDAKVNGKSIVKFRDSRLGSEGSTGFTLGVVGEWTIEDVKLEPR